MARPLPALERLFERLFERPAARVFRAALQPVQLERRVERAMEADRRIGAEQTYVPDRYRVQLQPDDAARFAGYQATLEAELGEAVLARARARGYRLAEAPRVTLHANAAVARGDIVVLTDFRDPLPARAAPAGFRRLDVAVGSPSADAPAGSPAAQAAEGGPAAGAGMSPEAVVPEATAVFAPPSPTLPPVILLVEEPGHPPRRISPGTASLTIGRGRENDVVLADPRVSRRHGRLAVRQGTLVYEDLGSTNGSFVNERRVDQVVLGLGDELWLGGCRLTVLAEGAAAWTL